MTQAMPPTQAVSLDSTSPPGTTKTSEPQEDFSGTLRDQLAGRSQDDTTGTASASNAKAIQEPPVDSDEIAAQTAVVTPAPVGETELALPIAASALTAQNNLTQGTNANPAQQGQLSEGTDPRPVMAALADTRSTTAGNALAAAPGQKRNPAVAASGAEVPVNVAGGEVRQALDPVRGKNQLAPDTVRNEGGLTKEWSMRGFSRVVEGVTAAPAQVTTTTVAPALAASAAVSQAALPSASPPPLSLAVETPLASPGWGNAIAARLVWGATQGMQSASIELNPRDLGPVSVKLQMAGDEASITFVSQHALVREAVEAALPRLREMFAGDGINLGEVDVSSGDGRADSRGDDPTSANDMQSQAHANASADAEIALSSDEDGSRPLNSLVDTFA